MSSGCLAEAAQELKYQDPNEPENYIILNPGDNSFYIHQASGENLSGTYTETSETYSFNCGWVSLTGLKDGDSIIGPHGNAWVKV